MKTVRELEERVKRFSRTQYEEIGGKNKSKFKRQRRQTRILKNVDRKSRKVPIFEKTIADNCINFFSLPVFP